MPAFGVPNIDQAGKRERDDDYARVVCALNDRWRVVVCKHGIQLVLQKSKAEGGHGRAWRGKGYFLTRGALIAACARLCRPCDTAALARLQALPEYFSP